MRPLCGSDLHVRLLHRRLVASQRVELTSISNPALNRRRVWGIQVTGKDGPCGSGRTACSTTSGCDGSDLISRMSEG